MLQIECMPAHVKSKDTLPLCWQGKVVMTEVNMYGPKRVHFVLPYPREGVSQVYEVFTSESHAESPCVCMVPNETSACQFCIVADCGSLYLQVTHHKLMVDLWLLSATSSPLYVMHLASSGQWRYPSMFKPVVTGSTAGTLPCSSLWSQVALQAMQQPSVCRHHSSCKPF